MAIKSEVSSIQIVNAIERNKIARGLDYVGFIPGLGSVSGLARLITGIAVMIFYCIKAAHANSGEKEHLFMWSTIAGHEALRGVLEIAWLFNILHALPCEKKYTPQMGDKFTDIIEAAEYPGVAHGKYIYKDDQNMLHYSDKNHDGSQVLWRKFTAIAPNNFAALDFTGKLGYVFKSNE
jgi:hypothetical protein